jgi:hypothetical protein
MSKWATVLFVIVLILIGPVMYVFARAHSLRSALDKVHVGDSTRAVLTTLGHPQEQARSSFYVKDADLEYRYRVWPIPEVWVVAFRQDKVIDKEEVPSR